MKKSALFQAMAVAAGCLCLAVSAPFGRAQEVFDNVVIILDASGSMSGNLPGSGQNKMEAAKTALKEVLKQVPKDTRIGLLVFSGANIEKDNDWVYPLGPRDDARLMAAIDLPRPGQGTPLGAYIKKGADRLLEERAKQFGYGTSRLLIVTDGEANDPSLVNRFTPEVIARGITVDVIGVAMNTRHTLATKVHSYRPANDLSALRKAVADVFAEVGGDKSDVAAVEAFELLKPLRQEVAAAMIKALSTSGNQPIGVQSMPSTPTPPRTVAPSKRVSTTPAPATRSAPHFVRTIVLTAILVPIFLVFLGIFLFVIIRSASKGSKRRR